MSIFTNNYEDDLHILEERISKLKFQTSTNRRKLLSIPESQGGSMLWGSTFRQHPKHYPKQRSPDPDCIGKNMTKVKEENPDLKEYFNQFRNLYFKDFKFNSVHINKNYATPPHFDSKNCGESVLIAMGGYRGGQTCLYNETNRTIEKHDARIKPLIFNGSSILHWVLPHNKGDRFTLVFFNSNRT